MAEVTTVEKPEFKEEVAFQYKGPKKSLDIYTAQVSRGQSVGTLYHKPHVDEIKFGDLADLFDVEDVMEEIVRPYLATHSLKASKVANLEASTFEKDAEGKIIVDEAGNNVVESFDDAKYAAKWLNLFGKLSTASESVRALKQQQNALMAQFGKLNPKTDYDKWMNTAKSLHEIQSKLDTIEAQKAASQEAATTEAPAQAEAA